MEECSLTGVLQHFRTSLQAAKIGKRFWLGSCAQRTPTSVLSSASGFFEHLGHSPAEPPLPLGLFVAVLMVQAAAFPARRAEKDQFLCALELSWLPGK